MAIYYKGEPIGNWSYIDRLATANHFMVLDATDICFYYLNYAPGHGYSYSAANNLIYNLKKPLEAIQINSSMRYYKNEAIKVFGEILASFVQSFPLVAYKDFNLDIDINQIALVPIPASRAHDDPLYDDRVEKAATMAARAAECTYCCLVKTDVNRIASHHGGSRDINAIRETVSLYESLPEHIKVALIVDDIITKGAHYKAVQSIVNERYPGIFVAGVMLGRATYNA